MNGVTRSALTRASPESRLTGGTIDSKLRALRIARAEYEADPDPRDLRGGAPLVTVAETP